MPCMDASDLCGMCRQKDMLIAAVPARAVPAAINSDSRFVAGAAVIFTHPDGIVLAGEVSHGSWLQLMM